MLLSCSLVGSHTSSLNLCVYLIPRSCGIELGEKNDILLCLLCARSD